MSNTPRRRRSSLPPGTENYRHSSGKRSNLPTEQTSRFMEDKDRRPVNYSPPIRSREGPVLSWGRVDGDLTTQATPLYIHEKIHPHAFVESLRRHGEIPPGLFDDFNNLPKRAAFKWYEHQGNWQNRIIRGPGCEVMASLLEKEVMAGKIQMIYFDPPYGIQFKANMQAKISNRDVGEQEKDIPNDPGQVKVFRDTYQNGIHSYLDAVYRTVAHARVLLADEGSFFLQMGSDNVHRLAVVLDEIFGSDNRIATISFAKSGGGSSKTLPEAADYLLWYAKNREAIKYHQIYQHLTRAEKIEHMSSYAMVEFVDRPPKPPTQPQRIDPDLLPEGARLYRRMSLVSQNVSTTGRSKPYEWNGVVWPCPPGQQWRVSFEGMDRLAELGRLDAASEQSWLAWKRYENEVPGRRVNNLWNQTMPPSDLHYVVETAESVIERCLLMTTDPGDLVLDPTCGSGTTAFVAEKWGRRWITIDSSSVAINLARQRIATGVFDYYLLQDSLEGARKEAEEHAKIKGKSAPGTSTRFGKDESGYTHDPAGGFVYDRVPTVSAGILAYDKDEPPTLLVDRPFKKSGTVRVSSPFTVESHSPYRMIDPESALNTTDRDTDSHRAIIDALSTAGIRDGETAIQVDDIADYPAEDESTSFITHLGVTDVGKAAIVIAPDDCTVPAQLINIAAEQAGNMPSVKTLIVIAFAFGPDARSSKIEKRGRLAIMKVQANQDLRIGDLTNTKNDRAFVLIGEPEIRVEEVPGYPDQITVEVLGYDTYNPSTGQVEVGTSATDIHCWMLDIAYDGMSFFAHRIHFPNGNSDKQITRFKKRLGQRVDPALWESMLSLKSAPFPRPGTGRIAVRIVTDTYTEMTAVVEISE